jgi:hypothetical protein
MGGSGSGNWYRWSTRPVVEDGLTLDLNRLIRQRKVTPGAWSSGSLTWTRGHDGERVASIGYKADLADPENAWMRLQYKHDDKPEDYKVQLTTTRPNFGGLRWWFICPARRIRMAKLHLAAGGDWFASRQAYGMAYRSQNEASHDRQASRAHQLRRKLGGAAGFDQPYPYKPKGMHWKTYNQICDEIEWLETTSMLAVAKRFGMMF